MNWKNKGTKNTGTVLFTMIVTAGVFGGGAYIIQQKRLVEQKREATELIIELQDHIEKHNEKIEALSLVIQQQKERGEINASEQIEEASGEKEGLEEEKIELEERLQKALQKTKNQQTLEVLKQKRIPRSTGERYWSIFSVDYSFGADVGDIWKGSPGRAYKVCLMGNQKCGTIIQYDGPYKDYLVDLYLYLAEKEKKPVTENELKVIYDQVPRTVTEVYTKRKPWKHGFYFYDKSAFFHEGERGSLVLIYDQGFTKEESQKILDTIDYEPFTKESPLANQTEPLVSSKKDIAFSEITDSDLKKNSSQKTEENSSPEDKLKRKVRLYYQNLQAKDIDVCSLETISPVIRPIPYTESPLLDTIKLLIAGNITPEEKEKGAFTEFPNAGFQLISAGISDGVLKLQFTEVPGFTSGGACRVTLLKEQIIRTARQFPEVQEVQFFPEGIFKP